jgi:hypothetical protein
MFSDLSRCLWGEKAFTRTTAEQKSPKKISYPCPIRVCLLPSATRGSGGSTVPCSCDGRHIHHNTRQVVPALLMLLLPPMWAIRRVDEISHEDLSVIPKLIPLLVQICLVTPRFCMRQTASRSYSGTSHLRYSTARVGTTSTRRSCNSPAVYMAAVLGLIRPLF